MAQTSINIQPVKGGSELHNLRKKDLDYVDKEKSKKNEHWILYPLDDWTKYIKEDYQKHHGKKLHSKATPIREGVVVIKEDTTMMQLHDACIRCREEFGIRALQIHIHRDEGHTDENGTWKPNLHAHIDFEWYDFNKHCTHKLNRQDMTEIQSIFAECLEMERGVSSSRKHLNAIQQKVKAEEEKLKKLKEQTEEKEKIQRKIQRLENGLKTAIETTFNNDRKLWSCPPYKIDLKFDDGATIRSMSIINGDGKSINATVYEGLYLNFKDGGRYNILTGQFESQKLTIKR